MAKQPRISSLTCDPNLVCAYCEHEWSAADSFELKEGSEVKCPECGAALEIVDVEPIRWWRTSAAEKGAGR